MAGEGDSRVTQSCTMAGCTGLCGVCTPSTIGGVAIVVRHRASEGTIFREEDRYPVWEYVANALVDIAGDLKKGRDLQLPSDEEHEHRLKALATYLFLEYGGSL